MKKFKQLLVGMLSLLVLSTPFLNLASVEAYSKKPEAIKTFHSSDFMENLPKGMELIAYEILIDELSEFLNVYYYTNTSETTIIYFIELKDEYALLPSMIDTNYEEAISLWGEMNTLTETLTYELQNVYYNKDFFAVVVNPIGFPDYPMVAHNGEIVYDYAVDYKYEYFVTDNNIIDYVVQYK